ncbi:unnamed protein product [Dracunculus medinensis]|uniref:Ubiquitin-like domain-containing protein n=1 Tax=Dracunculus medinensis TaxID=318479 RepID=A0A158Q5I1_DRAME|nr:unnamed protein product [Dracunculus medinensis]
MILTVSDDPEFQICHEVIVDNDATLSTFLNECVNNMKDYRNISLTDLLVVINGKKIIPGNKNLNEKLLNLGFSNADLVLVQKKPSHLVPSTSKQNDRTNIIADLVKAIKVPSHSKLNPNQVIARKHNLLESDIAAHSGMRILAQKLSRNGLDYTSLPCLVYVNVILVFMAQFLYSSSLILFFHYKNEVLTELTFAKSRALLVIGANQIKWRMLRQEEEGTYNHVQI